MSRMSKFGKGIRSRTMQIILGFILGAATMLIVLGSNSRIEPWEFGWTAVGAIATAAAVVVALMLPWQEKKFIQRKIGARRVAHTKLLAAELADRVYKLHAQLTRYGSMIERRITTETWKFPVMLAEKQDISFSHLEDVTSDLTAVDWDLMIEPVRTQVAALDATRRALISLTTMIYEYPHGGYIDAKKAIEYKFGSLLELIESAHVTCEAALNSLKPYLPSHMVALSEGVHRQGAAFSSIGGLGRKISGSPWVFPPKPSE